jgi:Secretion system C-terminal sorting domain
MGYYINRFRFLNDTLAYAVGQTVYKYTNKPIGIYPISHQTPSNFLLYQNYPNPFNPETKIRFEISSTSPVELIIYDAIGREITTLVNEELKPGIYEVLWDASDYSSGMYFYKLHSGEFVGRKKMVLIK